MPGLPLVRHQRQRPCADREHCGKAQYGPGHPRKGWIQVHECPKAADGDLWFCSWPCVTAYTARKAVQTGQISSL